MHFSIQDTYWEHFWQILLHFQDLHAVKAVLNINLKSVPKWCTLWFRKVTLLVVACFHFWATEIISNVKRKRKRDVTDDHKTITPSPSPLLGNVKQNKENLKALQKSSRNYFSCGSLMPMARSCRHHQSHILSNMEIFLKLHWSLGTMLAIKTIKAIINFWLTSERARRAMRVLPWFSGKIWVCVARHDHITLLVSLYLQDCASDFQAVFTGGWVHSSYLGYSRNWLIRGFTLAGSVIPREGCQNWLPRCN